jgi:hypothetical protein
MSLHMADHKNIPFATASSEPVESMYFMYSFIQANGFELPSAECYVL